MNDIKDIPFFISDRPAQLFNGVGEVEQAIDEMVEEHGQPALIIIDTLNRNFGNGDENSTKDMSQVIHNIDELRRTYDCSILIIHHSGLSYSDRSRGSSALRASLDWEYQLVKSANDVAVMSCTKSKDYEPPEPMAFVQEIVMLDEQENGEPVTSLVLHRVDAPAQGNKPLAQSYQLAYDTLRVSIKESGEVNGKIHVSAWRKKAYECGISTGDVSAKKKAFQRAVGELRKLKLIDTINDFYWIVDDKK